MAIIKPMNNDVLTLHLRASCFPNDAGVIAVCISSYYRVNVEKNFEFDKKGNMLWGQEAIVESLRSLSEPYEEPEEFLGGFIVSQMESPN